MRLTKKVKLNYFVNSNNKELTKLDIENDHNSAQIIRTKLGQLEDIEDELKKHTFYGKVLQYPNRLMELRFIEICKGNDHVLDIRIVFEVIGYGNVFYSIFQYGKLFALTKEELEK